MAMRLLCAKPLLIFTILSLCLVEARADPPPMLTADYYMLNPEQWLGKSVSLSVAWVEIPATLKMEDGYRVLSVNTVNNNRPGHDLALWVKPELVSHIVQVCGTTQWETTTGVMPHMIRGVFSKKGATYFLRVEK